MWMTRDCPVSLGHSKTPYSAYQMVIPRYECLKPPGKKWFTCGAGTEGAVCHGFVIRPNKRKPRFVAMPEEFATLYDCLVFAAAQVALAMEG